MVTAEGVIAEKGPDGAIGPLLCDILLTMSIGKGDTKVQETSRLTLNGAEVHPQRAMSFDDAQMQNRQRSFHKPNLRNHRLAMFKRSEIVTSIDENFADFCCEEESGRRCR